MPPSPGAEDNIYQAAAAGLRRWLGHARNAVMAPWRRMRSQPAPREIYSTVPEWRIEVERIAASLAPAIREGWAALGVPTNLPANDPYVQANVALTKNLLVRIPDEVHAQIVAEIFAGVNAQETNEQIAARVDNVLSYTGSENWDNRAKVIAATEVQRHFNGSLLAHGLLLEGQGRRDLRKQWDTRMDGQERIAHHDANGQTRPLSQPFLVGGEQLLFPVDPRGRPSNVINCRCDLRILGGFS